MNKIPSALQAVSRAITAIEEKTTAPLQRRHQTAAFVGSVAGGAAALPASMALGLAVVPAAAGLTAADVAINLAQGDKSEALESALLGGFGISSGLVTALATMIGVERGAFVGAVGASAVAEVAHQLGKLQRSVF